MRATAKIPFFDTVEGCQREASASFSCDQERAAYLVKCGIVTAEDEPEAEEKPKTTKRTRTRKKV